jgi:hypothetical protein
MRRNKDAKKVLGATALALGILLVGSALAQQHRSSSPLKSDSAVRLAQASFEDEKVQLRAQAQQLGSFTSTELVASQWKLLRSRMRGLGATPKTADDVLARVATSKHSIQGQVFLDQDQLWPLAVNSGYVKDNKVWVVHLAWWKPYLPENSGWCGTGDDDPFRQMAYLTYVVEDKFLHRCWVTPFHFELTRPEKQQECIKDYE